MPFLRNSFDKVFYFDWIFGVGAAQLAEENNREALNSGDRFIPFSREDHVGFLWSSALRFYMTKHWSLRLDLTAIHYKAQKALKGSNEKVFYDNFDLNLGLSYAF